MVKAVLIDDEKLALEMLRHLLKQYNDDIEIIGSFTNPFEALEKIKIQKADIIFLDIEMPEINGIDIVERFYEISSNMKIIFVTAFNEYAVEAFEINALDYLLKPVSKERFKKTVDRILSEFHNSYGRQQEIYNSQLLCFGSFELKECSEKKDIVKWRTSKVRELFAYMVHNRGKFIHKDRILEILWPDMDTEKSSALLHTSVYYIRKTLKALGIENCVQYTNNSYKLNINNIYCDVDEFEKIIKINKIDDKNIGIFEKIFDIYRGDYLEENGFFWAEADRERFARNYVEVLGQMSKYYYENQQYNNAIKCLQSMLDKNILLDDTHKMLMSIYALIGDNNSLIKQYEVINKAYREELGVEPDDSLKSYFYKLCNEKFNRQQ